MPRKETPVMEVQHQFVAEFHRLNGEAIGQLPLEVDWEPAEEWVWLTAQRRAPLRVNAQGWSMTLEPIAHPQAGSPQCDGFELTLAMDEGGSIRCRFSNRYFGEAATRASRRLMGEGRLQEGDQFVYSIHSFPITPGRPRSSSPVIQVERDPFPVRPQALQPLLDRAMPVGPMQAEDFPVFIPSWVLEEVRAQTERAGALEVGGILIGHLLQDPDSSELGALIRAHIPARHVSSESTSVTFHPETWSAARDAIALRGQGEMFLAWTHNHPARYWCASCPPERRRSCPLSQTEFFSSDDRQFHATAFPRAYTTALLVTNAEDGLKEALFGWREGRILRRGFHLLDPDDPELGPGPDAITQPTAIPSLT